MLHGRTPCERSTRCSGVVNDLTDDALTIYLIKVSGYRGLQIVLHTTDCESSKSYTSQSLKRRKAQLLFILLPLFYSYFPTHTIPRSPPFRRSYRSTLIQVSEQVLEKQIPH